MSNLMELKKLRDVEFFADWTKFRTVEQVVGSRDTVHQLIDELMALEDEPDETDVRAAVSRCVQRFNELDAGWIDSIERDDICETVWKLIDLAGFVGDEEWLDDREW